MCPHAHRLASSYATDMYTVQSGTVTGDNKNRTVPKRAQPIMAETDCDVVHCPVVRNKHWMFDPRLADILNQLAHFPI